jgi:6-phosphogluconolactonase (cycloisomerase 2 family)
MLKQLALATLAVGVATACSDNRDITAPASSISANVAANADRVGNVGGNVFTLTNSPAGNAVAIFAQQADGSLAAAGQVSTGGLGSGSGLGSQGSLTKSEDGRWLLAVNAGSNDISLFSIGSGDISLAGRAASGGTTPISVTIYHDLVYVLNAGGSGNISGFAIGSQGDLEPIAGSTQPLSGAAVGPAQVSFSSDGRWLVVTEKNTNSIDVYPVNKEGVAGAPVNRSIPGSGTTPFGFAFGKQDELVVSEAGTGSASSYTIAKDGTLSLISGAAATHQGAPCWVALTNDGRYAYIANATSGSITGFSVDHDGRLSPLSNDGVTGRVNAGAADLALSHDSNFLYQLDGSRITAFHVESNGQLTALGSVAKPAGSVGVAAF